MLLSNAITIIERLTSPTDTENIESQLLETAEFLNKSLPTMVDDVTKLYKVSVLNKQLTYHYQIINKNSFELTPSAMYKRMRPQLIRDACSSEDMKVFFQNGVTVSYSYLGSDNIMITNIALTPSDCGY